MRPQKITRSRHLSKQLGKTIFEVLKACYNVFDRIFWTKIYWKLVNYQWLCSTKTLANLISSNKMNIYKYSNFLCSNNMILKTYCGKICRCASRTQFFVGLIFAKSFHFCVFIWKRGGMLGEQVVFKYQVDGGEPIDYIFKHMAVQNARGCHSCDR